MNILSKNRKRVIIQQTKCRSRKKPEIKTLVFIFAEAARAGTGKMSTESSTLESRHEKENYFITIIAKHIFLYTNELGCENINIKKPH